MELQREKIQRIADKFTDFESNYLDTSSIEEYIKKLTVICGAKEAIFKIRNEKGISFKDHINVSNFSLGETQTQASLHFDNLIKDFDVHYQEVQSDNFEGKFTLVYAFEK
ncbi:hypothetical protein D9M71_761670 [compost metagenome]